MCGGGILLLFFNGELVSAYPPLTTQMVKVFYLFALNSWLVPVFPQHTKGWSLWTL
jgi:hypothetical protein